MTTKWEASKAAMYTGVVMTAVVALTGSALVWLFFLHRTNPVDVNAAPLTQLRQIERRLTALEGKAVPDQSGDPASTSAGGEMIDTSKEEHDLLSAEMKLTEGQIAEAQDAEKRTREAGTAFLGVFAILAAIVLGRGYLNLFEFKNDSQEKLDELEKKSQAKLDEIKLKTADLAHGLKTIGQARDIALQIDEVWNRISENELPGFLEESDKMLGKEEDLRQSEQLAVMDEIDAFTYLYPHFRFSNRSQQQSEKYLAALLQSVRGLIVKQNYWHAIRRLKEFLHPENKPLLSNHQLAKAHSYQAYAHYFLIQGFVAEPAWVRATKLATIEDSRIQALKSLEAAEQYDPGWKFTIFVRAQLYGCLPHPADRLGTAQGVADQIEGRRKAADEYRKLLPEIDLKQRYAVLQNLACELKFVAAYTGDPSDWKAFTETLTAFPAHDQLLEEFEKYQERHQLCYVWQNIMSDPDLFQTRKNLDTETTKAFWIQLLDKKMNPTQWRLDLAQIQERDSRAQHWDINLLQITASI
ncbi:MAG: hypothetical protein ABI383_05615 [Acidobacteriaceae bacterium]